MRGWQIHACGNMKLICQTSDLWHGCELILLLLTALSFEVCVHVYVNISRRMTHCLCGGQRTIFKSWFFLSTLLRQGLSFLPVHCSL